MNMKHMDVYLNYQVLVMLNLQTFKDQTLKLKTPHTSMCLEFVLVRDALSQCKEWRCLSRDNHGWLRRLLAQEQHCFEWQAEAKLTCVPDCLSNRNSGRKDENNLHSKRERYQASFLHMQGSWQPWWTNHQVLQAKMFQRYHLNLATDLT